mgnify:CR=1 FL=1
MGGWKLIHLFGLFVFVEGEEEDYGDYGGEDAGDHPDCGPVANTVSSKGVDHAAGEHSTDREAKTVGEQSDKALSA